MKITGDVMKYAWGKPSDTSKVADLAGVEKDGKERYAELWLGTHPKAPARISGETLQSFLQSHPEYMGKEEKAKFEGMERGELPFLLKVLSIDKPLSIQAHPDKNLGAILHAKDPSHYIDDNHKPEMLVALTPCDALCRFRMKSEIEGFIQQYPPLASLTGQVTHPNDVDDKHTIQRWFGSMMRATQEEVAQAIAAMGALRDESETFQLFQRVLRDFPGDIGCFCVFFLNYIQLSPLDGLFLGPCEPHAYLSGDAVEIMAACDNTIRAGLTPKFRDVEVLVHMLTYQQGTPSLLHPDEQHSYPIQVPDFQLYRYSYEEGMHTLPALPKVSIGLVLEGKGKVGDMVVCKGESLVIPAGHKMEIKVEQPFVLFRASTSN